MLKQYKMVSIIYGGSGAKYAEKMNRIIAESSEKFRYPITSKIVMESVLTGDLLTSITDLFTQTEFCIAFLTADDCCQCGDTTKYRLRQNVVFELGMAVYRLGRERCILLSDFDPASKDVELPSDFKGIDIKCFDADNQDEVFDSVLKKVLQLSSKDNKNVVPQYDQLLFRKKYFVNYSDLFAAYSHLESQEGSAYLKGVLDCWHKELLSFTHYEERALYFLERFAFLPMVGRHKWVYDWFIEIEKILSSYNESDIDYCGKSALNFARNLAITTSTILRLKLTPDYEPDYHDYEELLDGMLMESLEESKITNPLIATIYYDYIGLLHTYFLGGKNDLYHLDEAIACFEKVLDTYIDYTDMELGIWSGFVGYNLARCYLNKYKITNNKEDAEKAQTMFKKASRTRKKWLSVPSFNPTLRSALSYEYFICKIEQISSLSIYGNHTAEEISQEFKRLEGELETFMIHNEQLERLSFVQELLNKRQSEASDCSALAEKLL